MLVSYTDLVQFYKQNKLTPYNLYQYIKLDNYNDILIEKDKENSLIIARISFFENSKVVYMNYVFDYDDILQEIYHVNEEGLKEITYSRKEEEKNILKLLNKNKLQKISL